MVLGRCLRSRSANTYWRGSYARALPSGGLEYRATCRLLQTSTEVSSLLLLSTDLLVARRMLVTAQSLTAESLTTYLCVMSQAYHGRRMRCAYGNADFVRATMLWFSTYRVFVAIIDIVLRVQTLERGRRRYPCMLGSVERETFASHRRQSMRYALAKPPRHRKLGSAFTAFVRYDQLVGEEIEAIGRMAKQSKSKEMKPKRVPCLLYRPTTVLSSVMGPSQLRDSYMY